MLLLLLQLSCDLEQPLLEDHSSPADGCPSVEVTPQPGRAGMKATASAYACDEGSSSRSRADVCRTRISSS